MTRCSKLLCLLASTSVSSYATPIKYERPPIVDTLVISCRNDHHGDLSEVCQTMCYAINCMGITSDLFYDKKTDESNPDRLHEVGVRRGKVGCGQTNRCLQPPYNTPEKPYECDQYPPVSASTKQSAFTLPINRCVPADQYSREQLILDQFYKSEDDYKNGGLHGHIGRFRIAFRDYQFLPYCQKLNCNNDHNLYNIDKLAIATESPDPPHRYYLTKRGANLFIPAGADIGDMVRSHVFDEGNDQGSVELDEIVVLANATRIED